MKNIHILPTDKPSRLCYDKDDNLLFAPNAGFTIADGKQNIYITSNEEIKEGDWVLYGEETVMQVKSSYDNDMSGEDIWLGDSLNGLATNKDNCKKIILTTDQDLIKNGVQAIDDEFLEWFVKNQSCESIEVKEEFIQTPDNLKDGFYYKIIIPQETIEESAERYAESKSSNFRNTHIRDFKEGAKYQAERMYSEEDMVNFSEWVTIMYPNQIKLLTTSDKRGFYSTKELLTKWFEQFKKK